MATENQLNAAFRLAGLWTGRPTLANIAAANDGSSAMIPPDNTAALTNFFTDTLLNRLQHFSGESEATITANTETDVVGFEYFLAANIIEALTDAGLSLEGRSLDTFTFTMEGINRTFVEPVEYSRHANRKANELRV